jgi:hypothetical protein
MTKEILFGDFDLATVEADPDFKESSVQAVIIDKILRNWVMLRMLRQTHHVLSGKNNFK